MCFRAVLLGASDTSTAVYASTLIATQRSPGFGVALLLSPSARERLPFGNSPEAGCCRERRTRRLPRLLPAVGATAAEPGRGLRIRHRRQPRRRGGRRPGVALEGLPQPARLRPPPTVQGLVVRHRPKLLPEPARAPPVPSADRAAGAGGPGGGPRRPGGGAAAGGPRQADARAP